MKPIEVNSDSYLQYNEDSNEKDPKFKVGYYIRISKYKNIFAKGYILQIGLKKLLLAELKIQFHGHMLLSILMVKKLLEVFMKKNFKRLVKTNLEYIVTKSHGSIVKLTDLVGFSGFLPS